MDISLPGYWDEVYRAKDDGWELGAPTPPLVRALGGLPVERSAIVLGCGRGHEARLLARCGWPRVVAVDFAPTAIVEARRLTTDDAAARAIEWREADVFGLGATDAGAHDLAVEHTCFCAIDPKRRAEWVAVARAVLRPGGTLIGLFYPHGRPGGPPFDTTRSEVETLLTGPGGFAVVSVEVPPDGIERRAGKELLVRATRTG